MLPDQEKVYSQEFLALVEASRRHPIGLMSHVRVILDQLNIRAIDTQYEFYLLPVVDDSVSPNVAPYYFNGTEWAQPLKWERTGPVVQAYLERLPASVRQGQDERYEVWQIRLNELGSFEHLMGTTTLIGVFLTSLAEGDACFLMPDDESWQTNWQVIQTMHAKHFPSLPAGEQEV